MNQITMTTKADTSKTPKPFSERPFSEESSGKPRSGVLGNIFYLLVLVVVLGLLSWTSYVFYQQILADQRTTSSNDQKAQQALRLERLEAQFRADQAALLKLQETLAQYHAEQVSTAQALATFRLDTKIEIADIQERWGTDNQSWLYAEVAYLLRIAKQRLLMGGDTRTALSLLQEANESIMNARGSAVAYAYPLRQALAQDIATLKAAASPDIEGLYLDLSAQMTQVSQLQQKIPGAASKPMESPPEASPQTTSQGTLAVAGAIGERLLALFDFRQGRPPVVPLLPPREAYYLRHNLLLKLQITQLALLEKNQEVYQTSLAEAQDWVQRFFDPEHAVTQAMLASFSQLRQARVDAEVPDISSSLREARSLLAALQHTQTQPAESP